MQRLMNTFKLLKWEIKKRADLPGQTIAPILWNEARLKDIPDNKMIGEMNEEQKKHFYKVIEEVEMISKLSSFFPSRIGNSDWRILLNCSTRKQRLDHIKYLTKKEKLREKEKMNEEAVRQERKYKKEERISVVSDENLEDRVQLLHISRKNLAIMERNRSWIKLARAHMMSCSSSCIPSLVIDCRFLPFLSQRGANLTVLQLNYLVSDNRDSRNPFPLYFANFDENNQRNQDLRKKHLSMADIAATSGPIITSLNYTQLFPKQKIIYLSPHAEQVLDSLEDDVVYVLGGIVDRVPERGIDNQASLKAANQDDVRCYKLPLDKYVKWRSGTKYLTLTSMRYILEDVHATGGDWSQALAKHIPVRNTRPPEEANAAAKKMHNKIREFDRELLSILSKKLGNEY